MRYVNSFIDKTSRSMRLFYLSLFIFLSISILAITEISIISINKKEVFITGANYPVKTNVTGKVYVAMGKGVYHLKIKPNKNVKAEFRVYCSRGGNKSSTITRSPDMNRYYEIYLNCREGVIVEYNATIPPHKIIIAYLEVERR